MCGHNTYDLPVRYDHLDPKGRWLVMQQYIKNQRNRCWHCEGRLDLPPPQHITDRCIKWELFGGDADTFLAAPVHLQHNHTTMKTEGAVHAYCNAVLWQYYGR